MRGLRRLSLRRRPVVVLLPLYPIPVSASSDARLPDALLFVDADVYAPAPLGRRHVLVQNGQITGIYDRIPMLDEALEVETIDVRGCALVPGFLDAHVHVTGGGGEAGFASSVPPLPLSAFTTAGVTTVVGLLGTDDVTRSVENLVARTYALRQEGLSAWCWTGGYHTPPPTLTGDVRRDIVFLDPVVGLAETAISDHRSSQPTFDEIARLAAECHVAGMIAGKSGCLHLHIGDGPRGLALLRRLLDDTELPARSVWPTHVNRQPTLLDEALALAARGVTVDVTAFPDDDLGAAISAADALERAWEAGVGDFVSMTSDAGGSLPVFRPDGTLDRMGVARPGALLDTVRTLLGRGHSLDRILPAITTVPARQLRLARKGRIAAGMDADLLVLDLDGETTAVRHVVARGALHVRDGRLVRRGTFE